MKICFVVQDMSLGGASTMIQSLIENWDNDKDELILISFFDIFDKRYSNLLNKKNVTFYSLKKRRLLDIPFLARLKKLIFEIKPDVISSHLTCVFYLKLINVTKKIRVFHTIHSEPAKDLPFIYRFLLKRDILKRRVRLLGVCEYISNKANLLYKTECITIYNGMLIQPTISNHDPSIGVNFLFVGRFDVVKNIPLLIDCFGEVANERCSLVICGYGKEEKNILDAIEKNPNKDRIKFVGKQNNLEQLYLDSDVLCLISEREGMPFTILEGINFGLSFIATDVGSVSEFVVNEFNGYVIKTANKNEIIERMENAANNPGLIKQMKCNSTSFKEKIDVKIMVQKYKEAFNGK